MRVRVAGDERVGQAVDLRSAAVEPGQLSAALADPSAEWIDAPAPTPPHDAVGLLQPGMELDLRTALAAAGRSLGLVAPQAAEIARLDREIAAIEPDSPDLRAARHRAAEAGADVAALEEQVARTSGRLAARREADLPTEAVQAKLDDLTRKLTEAETEQIAAQEALERAEAAAQAARDARARRLSLVDRRENRRREARAWFLDALAEPFERALASLPGDAAPTPPASFDGPTLTGALAVARIADLSTPVVLVDGPFETAVEARAALDAPVVLASV
ncbi:DUF7856 family protein [Halodesulfurarchaeum formicicum]|uniref:DUF7856 family protein n=1 Tax=Halodesulfurarchaeum formicicum TaxID=1873524 RepID=UPI0009035679|nr:hypothetical protein [Halodesulfurarchaeum formicicum]